MLFSVSFVCFFLIATYFIVIPNGGYFWGTIFACLLLQSITHIVEHPLYRDVAFGSLLGVAMTAVFFMSDILLQNIRRN